jgi:hypothetical protein
MRQNRLQLGAEKQRAVIEHGVVQRLDAEPVARHEERLTVAVPQRKGEHAAEAVHALLAPLLPGVHDDFGVALGVEDVAVRLQLGYQLAVVVDLAVEDDHHRAVLIEQGLLTGGDVDDGQAPVAKAETGLDMQTAFIRAAVQLRVVHALQDMAVHRAGAACVELTRDAAHVFQSRSGWWVRSARSRS